YTATPVSYRKSRGAAGEAVIPVPHTPNSHGGRRNGGKQFVGWRPDLPTPSYKGGASAAQSAKLYTATPVSYRKSRGAAGEAAIPMPHTPNSHGGRRFNGKQFTGWQPDLPLPSYNGFRLSNLRFGAWRLDAPIPSYKGSFAPAKVAELTRQAPQTHRRRFNGQRLTGKTWCIPVDSYRGGYGVAGVGRPRQALPPSYKGPWGGQRRYTGVMLATPIRMDGSPRPTRTAMELPMSYKEPWGGNRRYTGVRFRLPIRMDGSPTPRSRAVVELPMSYKEPWGSQRRYGKITAIPHPFSIRMDGSPVPESKVVVEPPMSYKEPWGSQKRYGRGWEYPPLPKAYHGGSVTNPKAPWQDPETGEVYVEHLSDAKRYGNRRYGGKLYAQRSCKHYQAKKPETANIT
ncbi:MAG: hypothetical protein LUG65_05840, partial [Clostridiales bacterium]|nr:hypothetical protein [Clostridiales bacterium]